MKSFAEFLAEKWWDGSTSVIVHNKTVYHVADDHQEHREHSDVIRAMMKHHGWTETQADQHADKMNFLYMKDKKLGDDFTKFKKTRFPIVSLEHVPFVDLRR